MKIGIIGIDFQNDFMDQPNAALPVPGAVADAKRFATFIEKFAPEITSVYLTQDSHHALDIAHPGWWAKADGSPVDAFTPITYKDISEGKFVAKVHMSKSNKYVRDLEDQGEFGHFIWPEHCLIGSWGHGFQEDVFKAITSWERSQSAWVNIITKGSNPYTEHFGAFRANIPQANDPSTQLSQALLTALQDLDVLYFTGEARSHCVANSLRQLCDEASDLLPKMVIISDCMSDVPGLPAPFYDTVQGIYDRAAKMGARFAKTSDFSNLTSLSQFK
jgi:nicotinamidase-related amidase